MNETIDDIVEEMRQSQETMRCAQKPYTEHLLRTFADRIEAAAAKVSEKPTGCGESAPLRNCDRYADGKAALDAWTAYQRKHLNLLRGWRTWDVIRWLYDSEEEGGAE